MNTKDKGNVTEAVIMTELLKKGYTVLQPFGDNVRYDLVVDTDGVFIRIQCKSSRLNNGTHSFKTCSSYVNTLGKSVVNKYTEKEIDCFMITSPNYNTVYLIDVVNANNKEVRLRIDTPKNKGVQFRIRWAKDYEQS